MEEISNKTLATLLVIAIIVSIGGTLISINRLSRIGLLGVTGFGTTGKVNLTVQTTTGISVTQEIDFGTGYANVGTNCTMESNLSSGSRADTDCQGTNWPTYIVDATKRYIMVNNTGNQNINVSINASSAATSWIGANSTAEYGAQNASLYEGCPATNRAQWTTLTTGAPTSVCANSTANALGWVDGADITLVAARVTVSSQVAPGLKTVDVGFWTTY